MDSLTLYLKIRHIYNLPVNVIVSEVSMDPSRIILLLFLTLFIDISKENFIPERFGQVLEDEKNSGFSQTLLCYDNEFSGRSVMFTGYEPALGNVIFDNMYGRGQCEGDYVQVQCSGSAPVASLAPGFSTPRKTITTSP